jgi:hypothetical protein
MVNRITKNCEKYFFNDFTLKNYDRLLLLAKSKYAFVGVEDIFSINRKKVILLRHDIDYSLESAVVMSQIEQTLNIKSLYFLLPHSSFYNLLDEESQQFVREILDNGHELGLHFDARYNKIHTKSQLINYLNFEKELIYRYINYEVKIFSFHYPTLVKKNFDSKTYAGLINTYSKFIKDRFSYCSDSNGFWRHNRFEDILKDKHKKNLHILIHPEWWQKKIMSPRERVYFTIDSKVAYLKKEYHNFTISKGRKDVDW